MPGPTTEADSPGGCGGSAACTFWRVSFCRLRSSLRRCVAFMRPRCRPSAAGVRGVCAINLGSVEPFEGRFIPVDVNSTYRLDQNPNLRVPHFRSFWHRCSFWLRTVGCNRLTDGCIHLSQISRFIYLSDIEIDEIRYHLILSSLDIVLPLGY